MKNKKNYPLPFVGNVSAPAVKIGVGIGVAALVFGVYHFYWKNRFKSISTDRTSAPANISPQQAQRIAQRLYEKMKGFSIFQSDNIMNYFKISDGNWVNANGFILIYNAFGKREPATSLSFIGNRSNIDLSQWLLSELTDSERNTLRAYTKVGRDLIP